MTRALALARCAQPLVCETVDCLGITFGGRRAYVPPYFLRGYVRLSRIRTVRGVR